MTSGLLPPPPRSWDWDGVAYALPGEVNYDAEDAFADWLRRDVARQLDRDRKQLSPERVQLLERGYREDVAAHAFDFGEPASVRCLTTHEGLVRLGMVLMAQAGGKPPLDLPRRLRGDSAARDRLVLLVWEALDPLGRGWLATSSPARPSAPTSPPASDSAATEEPTSAASAGALSGG